jgi:hypothetical protein
MGGALLNIATLNFAAALLLGCWIVSILISSDFFQLTIPRSHIALVIFMIGLLALQVSTGRGFVMLVGGFYLLVFALVYYQMLKVGRGASFEIIIRGISFIHKFFLAGLIVEFVIIVSGGQPFLAEIFATTEALPYRLTAQPDIPRMLGIFDRQGGLNSILLGPQISGMLALFSVVWFVGIRKISVEQSIEKHPRLWIAVSILMFLICLNGTVAVLTLLALVMYGVFVNRRVLLPGAFLFVVLIAILYALIANQLLFERIFSGGTATLQPEHLEKVPAYIDAVGLDTFDFYIFAFTLPFTIYNFIGWTDILIGVGAEAASTQYVFLGSDLGFFTDVVVKSGVLWALVFVSAIIAVCFPVLSLPDRDDRDPEVTKWRTLASVNAYLCILWLASTAHYNQALTNSGGVMLFALHLAVVMYARRRARMSAFAGRGR